MSRGTSIRMLAGTAGAVIVVCASMFLSSCGGSKRGSVSGYTDNELNGKRVFVLLPKEGDYKLTDSSAFAWSRGIADAGASGRVYSEFRTNLSAQIDYRYDSNTVHNYVAQSVGATNPLDPEVDFEGDPSGWDWTKIDAAMKVGAIDYLLVFSDITVANSNPGLRADRGRETVTVTVSMIDLPNRRLVLTDNISITVDDPRIPTDTYVILARRIAEELPFFNRFY